MLVMAWSGPRLSEAAAIEYSWLLREDRSIRIRGVWVKDEEGQWLMEPTKTGDSRPIPVPRLLWDRLIVHADGLPLELRRPGRPLFPPTGATNDAGVYTRLLWRTIW